jgi:argininosuccinate lyase
MMALWGGRFSADTNESLEKLSQSVHFDWRLAPYDIRVNLAHLEGLISSGVVSVGNGEIIKAGLKALGVEIESGKFSWNAKDEDVHSAIERGLIEKIGPLGGSIRAGRSRNDLVITDFKLYLIDHLLEVSNLINELVMALAKKASEQIETIAPGFTHLQHAQPISFGHELAKHCHSLQRDIDRIVDWLDRNSSSPLGASALAGSPLSLEVEKRAKSLGFDSVSKNSIDAVSDRDFVLEALFILAQIGIHLSRIGEEYTIWNTAEFGWVTLDDKFSTGSSIMPQKKNPDIAELARGKSGRLVGNLTSLLIASKGLAFAYNRDLQEDKEPTFDSIETLLVLLPALTGMVESSTFHKEVIEKDSTGGFALATEIADFLSKEGLPFSQAHEIAGKCVKYCESKSIKLEELTAADLAKIDPNLTSAVLSNLNPAGAIASRSSTMGTAITSVKRQIDEVIRGVEEADSWISNARNKFSGMMSL